VANTVQIKIALIELKKRAPVKGLPTLGGYVSSQWKITLNEAIGKIESGERAFFAHRRTVGVIVAVSPLRKKYLKTEADGDQPDTLIYPIF
jgi:Protein of unknown function (DUF3892)